MQVEQYNPSRNEWTTIPLSTQFTILFNTGCLQINENEMFIFGGHNEKRVGENLTWLLLPNLNDQDDENDYDFTHVNVKKLKPGSICGFWNN